LALRIHYDLAIHLAIEGLGLGMLIVGLECPGFGLSCKVQAWIDSLGLGP